MARRKPRSFAALLRAKKLTPAEKRRLTALKAAKTRSEKKYSIRQLQNYEFWSLSDAEQFRLRQHWSKKAARTRKKRTLERKAEEKRKQKQFDRQFKEIFDVAQAIAEKFDWTIWQSEYDWVEVGVDPDTLDLIPIPGMIHPLAMANYLRRLPAKTLAIYARILIACKYKIEDYEDPKTGEVIQGGFGWTTLANVIGGENALAHASAALRALIDEYLAEGIVMISFTYL
jgi:hypothetical protein